MERLTLIMFDSFEIFRPIIENEWLLLINLARPMSFHIDTIRFKHNPENIDLHLEDRTICRPLEIWPVRRPNAISRASQPDASLQIKILELLIIITLCNEHH